MLFAGCLPLGCVFRLRVSGEAQILPSLGRLYAAVLAHDAVHEMRVIRIRVACRGMKATTYATP